MKDVETLFATWVERLVVEGVRLDARELAGGDEAAMTELQRCIAEYDALQETLETTPPEASPQAESPVNKD